MIEQLRNKTKEELWWDCHFAEEENDILKDFIQLQKDIMFPEVNLVAIKQIIHFVDFCIQNTYIDGNPRLFIDQARATIESLDDYDVDELSNSEIIDCLIVLRNFMIANHMLEWDFKIITWEYILKQWDILEQKPFKICPTVDPIDLGQGIDWRFMMRYDYRLDPLGVVYDAELEIKYLLSKPKEELTEEEKKRIEEWFI